MGSELFSTVLTDQGHRSYRIFEAAFTYAWNGRIRLKIRKVRAFAVLARKISDGDDSLTRP